MTAPRPFTHSPAPLTSTRHVFPMLVVACLSLASGIWLGSVRADEAERTRRSPAAGGAPDSLVQSVDAAYVVDPEAPQRAGSRMVWIPSLSAPDGGPGCDPFLAVQNVGHEPSVVAFIVWGELGACPPQANGPIKVDCSGMIRPGSTWHLSRPQIPVGARGLVGVSLSTRTTSEIGIDVGFETAASDYLCETLIFGALGDHGDLMQFLDAYRTGEEFAQMPLERAQGAPIAVTVLRTCGDPNGPAGAQRSVVRALMDAEVRAARHGNRYRYAIPISRADVMTDTSTALHIQNTGSECAEIRVEYRRLIEGTSNPEPESPCVLTLDALPPGESWTARLDQCASDEATIGSVIVEADRPLAVVADSRQGDGYHSIAGLPIVASIDSIAAGYSGTSDRFSIPLLYNEVGGWVSRVYVQSVDATAASTVTLSFRDRNGDVVASEARSLPPLAGTMVDLQQISVGHGTDAPYNWVGSALVESRAQSGADEPGAAIAVAVEAVRNSGTGGGTEASAYLAQPNPTDDRGVDTSIGALLAVPYVSRRRDDSLTTQLAIGNVIEQPGFTDFALLIFDQNGLLDTWCHKLTQRQVVYIDFATLGSLNPGFVGSAVVSATVWEHEGVGGSEPIADPVGLTAVYDLKPVWLAGSPTEDDAGDQSYAEVAIRIPEDAQARFNPSGAGNAFSMCGFDIAARTPTPWPTLTPTPTPTPTTTPTITSMEPTATATSEPSPTVEFSDDIYLPYLERRVFAASE